MKFRLCYRANFDLERVQRRWIRAENGFSKLSYDERLRLNLFYFQGRLLRCDLILVWKIFHNKCAKHYEELFALECGRHQTKGHDLKMLYLESIWQRELGIFLSV